MPPATTRRRLRRTHATRVTVCPSPTKVRAPRRTENWDDRASTGRTAPRCAGLDERIDARRGHPEAVQHLVGVLPDHGSGALECRVRTPEPRVHRDAARGTERRVDVRLV